MYKIGFLITLIFSSLAHAGVSQWADFKLDNGHIKVPVVISGINTFAVLDTGAQLHAINSAFLTKNKLKYKKGTKVNLRGVFGTEKKSMLNNIPIALFGFETELDKVVPARLGHHTTGMLLGAGFFGQFIVQLDYPKSRMRLITRDSLDLKSIENIPLVSQRGSGEPIVKVRIGDSNDFWVLLDTGNNGGLMIERDFAEKLNLLDKSYSSGIAMGANSIAFTESVQVDEFIFGPYTLENVRVTIPAAGQKASLEDQNSIAGSRIKSKRQRGVLGYDVLKHFVLTLDYRKGHAHIALPE